MHAFTPASAGLVWPMAVPVGAGPQRKASHRGRRSASEAGTCFVRCASGRMLAAWHRHRCGSPQPRPTASVEMLWLLRFLAMACILPKAPHACLHLQAGVRYVAAATPGSCIVAAAAARPGPACLLCWQRHSLPAAASADAQVRLCWLCFHPCALRRLFGPTPAAWRCCVAVMAPSCHTPGRGGESELMMHDA